MGVVARACSRPSWWRPCTENPRQADSGFMFLRAQTRAHHEEELRLAGPGEARYCCSCSISATPDAAIASGGCKRLVTLHIEDAARGWARATNRTYLQEGNFPAQNLPTDLVSFPPTCPIRDCGAIDRTAALPLACRLQMPSQNPPTESHAFHVFHQAPMAQPHLPSSHCDGAVPPLFGLQPQISQGDEIPCLPSSPAILRSQEAHPALCDNTRGWMRRMACSPWLLWLTNCRKSTYQLEGATWT